jgi:uncharacterized iron-regulated protein
VSSHGQETRRKTATGSRAGMAGVSETAPTWPQCSWSSLVLVVLFVTACATPEQPRHGAMPGGGQQPQGEAVARPISATPALDLSALSNLEGVIPELAEKRVVFVGESHDRYDHHLTQLEIIRRLHAIQPQLAIGMEMFQQPFQRYLDAYVAGKLSEAELLRSTEYYRRWRFDFRLYAPILRYAREHQLPVVALNLPVELTRKVGGKGIDGLTQAERAAIPEAIDRSDTLYVQRLKAIFDQHPHKQGQSFEHFLEVQLLWDEGMAERAAAYLKTHPDHAMVVLAGSGHLAHGSGIPRRLVRRVPVSSAIVLNSWEGGLEPGLADFLLLPQKRVLPAAGKLGALLAEQDGKLKVDTCISGSPCEAAGIRQGDQVLAVNGKPVVNMADLREVTWDKKPGDKVTLEIRRTRWFAQPQELSYELELR